MISSSSSSDGGLDFALMNGDADQSAATVVASLRVGDNSIQPDGLSEFGLAGRPDVGTGSGLVADGHLTWDASYSEACGGDFDSVASVRLVLRAPQLLWSVGTVNAVRCPPPAYRRLTKIQVLAAAHRRLPCAQLRWDALHLRLITDDGQSGPLHALPCLPHARSRAETRRASGYPRPSDDTGFQRQFAEILLPSTTIGIELKGQVSLRSQDADPALLRLSPDDLHAKVFIFAQ